jgi:excisionase family DNA binding protein
MTPQVHREALSLQEGARLLGVHEDTLINWHKRKMITLVKMGPRLWRVPRAEIARLRKPKNAE